MLTPEQIRDIASDTLRQHGMLLVGELEKGCEFDGGNLIALFEVFGKRLLTLADGETVAQKRTTVGIGPRLWWLCEADDPSRGAMWTREPDADDIALIEEHKKCSHVSRRMVLE